MGKLFRFLGGIAATAAATAGAAYLLQKKGILNIEVNYNDKEGKPVTRGYDEIIDTAVDTAGKKVTDTYDTTSKKVSETVTSVANDTRDSVAKALDQASSGLENLADNIKKVEKKVDHDGKEEETDKKHEGHK